MRNWPALGPSESSSRSTVQKELKMFNCRLALSSHSAKFQCMLETLVTGTIQLCALTSKLASLNVKPCAKHSRKRRLETVFSSFLWKMVNGLDVAPALKCYWHEVLPIIRASFARAALKLKLFSRFFFFNFVNGKLNDPMLCMTLAKRCWYKAVM